MSADQIANYIVFTSTSNKSYVNSWKVQYLLYYIQQYYLQELDKKAFDDPIVAVAFGPMISTVKINLEKQYGRLDIKKYSGANPTLLNDDKKVVDKIIRFFKNESFVTMKESIIKDPDSPWFQTYKDGEGRNSVISDDLLKNAKHPW